MTAKQTPRDKRTLRAVVRYMVRAYRQAPTNTHKLNIWRVYAQRHNIVYDYSGPLPIPRMKWRAKP